jgi:hypothetical protein
LEQKKSLPKGFAIVPIDASRANRPNHLMIHEGNLDPKSCL